MGDTYAGTIPGRTLILSTFCRAVQMSGGSNIEVAQLGLPKTYRIGVQQRKGFTPGVNMVVEYDGFDHKISSIEVKDERQGREWILTLVRNEH
ncbi:MAG: hypothetical protein ACRCU2_00490 [Planktothrix sp.]